MFNAVLEKDRDKKLIDGGLDISRLMNISIVNREGNAVIRRHLESLPLESFDSVSSIKLELDNIFCSNMQVLLIENEEWYCMEGVEGLAQVPPSWSAFGKGNFNTSMPVD